MSKTNLRVAIIVLTVITALVHLSLNLGPSGIQPAFLANAIGYIVLLVVFFKWINLGFLAGREKMVWYGFMGYVVVTIVAYFVVNGGAAFSNPIGLFDKAVEVVLLITLWLHKEN
jgi:hypothetical protein